MASGYVNAAVGQGVTLGRDAGLATTLLSVPVLFTVVALLD